jgi:hypothetical protein
MFVEWGEGGRAALMSRLMREYRGDKGFGHRLTRADLAVLLDHFRDDPIPLELRAILQEILRGKRKLKACSSRKELVSVAQIEDMLLVEIYTQGMATGRKLRTWLKQRQKKQRRNARPYTIPTARNYACYQVRRRLTKFRGLIDASISNEVSERRDTPRRQRRKPSGGTT